MKPPYVPDRLKLNQLALGGIDNIDISLSQDNENTIQTASQNNISKVYSGTGGTRSNIRQSDI